MEILATVITALLLAVVLTRFIKIEMRYPKEKMRRIFIIALLFGAFAFQLSINLYFVDCKSQSATVCIHWGNPDLKGISK